MSATVFFVVILAALLHASWNALVKNGPDKSAAMAAIVIGHVPPALAVLALGYLPAPASWPYVLGGAALHVGYQIVLARAYAVGDLTQVYPIARGIAPLIVAFVSVVLLGVSFSPAELLAILMVAIGIGSIALTRKSDRSFQPAAAGLALLTGCFIASYSLVDGLGARVAGTALGFYSSLTLVNAVALAAGARFLAPGLMARAFRARRQMLLGGGASFVAYSLVVWAFTQAPIAHVTALRETSIVFALLIGVFALGERFSLAKAASTFVTLAGAALLRLAR